MNLSRVAIVVVALAALLLPAYQATAGSRAL